MPLKSQYRPEVARSGTEASTTKRNIENIFAILNRLENELRDAIKNFSAAEAQNFVGLGTDDYLAKFGAAGMSDSVLSDDGSTVFIGDGQAIQIRGGNARIEFVRNT